MACKNKIVALLLLMCFLFSQLVSAAQSKCNCYSDSRLSKYRGWLQRDSHQCLNGRYGSSFTHTPYKNEYNELRSNYQKIFDNLNKKHSSVFHSNPWLYSDFEAVYSYLYDANDLVKEWNIQDVNFAFDRNYKCSQFDCDPMIIRSRTKYDQDIEDIHRIFQKGVRMIERKHFETDVLFQEIMEKCMFYHANPKTFYDYGYFQFQRGNYESAMRASKKFLEVADENDKTIPQSEIYLLLGQSYSQALDYTNAVTALTKVIECDSKNSEAYIERAIAYFELGHFDLALSDFLSSGKTTKRALSSNSHRIQFTLGFAKGGCLGLADGAKETPASLMHSMHGMGKLLWASVSHPIETYGEVSESVHEMITYLRSQDPATLAKNMVPELRELLEKWESLEPNVRGEKAGYILGRYGIEIIIPGAAVKAIKKYQNLRRANALCTLETMSSSVENRIVLEKLAQESLHQRECFFKKAKIHSDKQGKHVVGHKNYNPKVGEKHQPSIFKHDDSERLLQEYSGKGVPLTSFKHGQGYKEVVDFKEYIGDFFDRETKQFRATTRGTIHYDKNGGAHIVPAPPEFP
jgi:tetratricopeptide (TPR) repeat protein